MEQQETSTQASGEARRSPLAALLFRLFQDSETLLMQELALFRAELGENAGRLIGAALVALAGLLVVLMGVAGLAAAAAVLLSRILQLWLACASLGLALAAAGALLLLYARRLVQSATFVPARTLQSLRDTRDWMRAELT